MKERIAAMNGYFDEQTALCDRRRSALRAEGYADDADFEKIRANVFEIFRTVLSVAVKTHPDDPSAVRQFFLQKAEEIPKNWRSALNAAEQHGDAARIHPELLKLDTVDAIRARFAEVWGESL